MSTFAFPVAPVLVWMGYQPLMDFRVVNNGDGTFTMSQWLSQSPQPAPAEIEAARLPSTKAARIEADRQECQRRIYQYWPLQEQITALAGNYEPGGMDSLINWQDLNIRASNAARDIINLQSTDTVAKVEAVTVAWPVWNG